MSMKAVWFRSRMRSVTCAGSASAAARSGGRVSKSMSPYGVMRAVVPWMVVVMFTQGAPPSGG
ncbi:hypothetical protein BU52_33435 [Streptomyces toyocaensis]|uniref:Uncharacterized protein n=1 Tax=Streptomyces toyocaensis TaxID=55952 RepID=A0A081XH79_STRTO|nr:hypothetical protein BU52_33435 [Streptomyces toyocaensis]